MRWGDFRFRLSLLGAVFASMVWGYWLMISDHAPHAWTSVEEDMTFAFLVPFVSLYVVWRDRDRLLASFGEPSAWGFLSLLVSLLAGFLGIRGHQLRLEVVGFAGTVFSLAWIFFGGATARLMAFPCAFLLFCMPLATFLDVVTVHLRLLAVSIAYGVLQGVGADVVRTGTMLTSSTGSFAIDVASPCSGLRSLFAMVALTAGYAYFTLPTWTRRAALFALSVPIAILGNVVRILTIVAIAATCDVEFATGFYHDYSGYVVFLVAVAAMVGAGGLLRRLPGGGTD